MLARRFVSVIRLVFSVGAALTLAVASIDRAESQEAFPSKPIRILVGFAAGGGNDLLARIVAQKLSENIGQPVVVENKAGRPGRLAAAYIQGPPAAGCTRLCGVH